MLKKFLCKKDPNVISSFLFRHVKLNEGDETKVKNLETRSIIVVTDIVVVAVAVVVDVDVACGDTDLMKDG